MDITREFEIYTIDDIYALPDGARRANWWKDLLYNSAKYKTSKIT